MNTGQVADGLQAHQDALAIFEILQDSAGLAETFDLLGMANGIFGDNIQAVEQYDRSIHTLRMLNDRQGLIFSLASRGGYASPALAETTPSTLEPLEHCSRDLSEALSLARQVDSMSGQAFSEWVAGLAYASFGQFGQALAHSRESLRIATLIQHTQWVAAAYFTLGRVYLSLLESTWQYNHSKQVSNSRRISVRHGGSATFRPTWRTHAYCKIGRSGLKLFCKP